MLATDIEYDDPCVILDEEFMRGALTLGEDTKLEAVTQPNGCEFEWNGNKVALSFAGRKPFESIYNAEHEFDKMYKSQGEAMPAAAASAPEEVPATHQTEVAHEGAAPMAEAKPAVHAAHYTTVAGVGDKAVWDAAEGVMHVLYINHIITVKVETKGSPDAKKEQAQRLAEVLIEKIADGEYSKEVV